MIPKFDGQLYNKKADVIIKTVEGAKAVQDAIKFLSMQQPVPKMKSSKEISRACKDHVSDLGSKGLHQHDSSDGKTGVKERLNKYGQVICCYGENLAYMCDNAREVML